LTSLAVYENWPLHFCGLLGWNFVDKFSHNFIYLNSR